MVATECGILREAMFPTLWEKAQMNHGELGTQNTKFRNRITGQVEESPRPALGGVLADVSDMERVWIFDMLTDISRKWGWERRSAYCR